MEIRQLFRDLYEIAHLPKVEVNLMYSKSMENHEYYKKIVEKFYREANSRHPKLPLIKYLKYGIAMLELPKSFDEYLMMIEASSRRNCKKALRNGYEFKLLNTQSENFSRDIKNIRTSTTVRQGPMSKEFLNAEILKPSKNKIVSMNPYHDYPGFGIYKGDTAFAYAYCFICGEACFLEHYYGHAGHLSFGIVPLLITQICKYVMQNHPQIKYYIYDKYYGAAPNMRRFKKKFHFLPHNVTWRLDNESN